MDSIWLGVLVIYMFAALTAGLWVAGQVRRKRIDPFFAIFFVSALIYLQLAPTLAVIFQQQATTLSLPSPSIGQYVLVQTFVWLAFIGPLWFFYNLKLSRPSRGCSDTRIVPGNWKLACSIGVILPLLYLSELFSRGIVFQRVGTAAAAQRVIDLPITAYAVVRLFDVSAYFLAAIFLLLRLRAETKAQRNWATVALVSVSIGFMIPAAVNSRLNSATFIFNLVAWRSVLSPKPFAPAQGIRRTGLLALAAALLFGEVALNAREMIPRALAGEPVPGLAIYSPLGSGEGLARLDCVDLIARTEPMITRDGPAFGAAWQSVPWLLLRYIDPVGFDAFRSSGRTTAKGYMLQRYLGIDLPDYYSCSLTDQFGNFWFFGFLFSGAFFGFAFKLIRRRIMSFDSAEPRALMVTMFLACVWLQFEQEASSMFFGWTNLLPIIVVFFLFPPIRSSAAKRAVNTDVAVFADHSQGGPKE